MRIFHTAVSPRILLFNTEFKDRRVIDRTRHTMKVALALALLAGGTEGFSPAPRVSRVLPGAASTLKQPLVAPLGPSSRESAGDGGLNLGGLTSDVRVPGLFGVAAACVLGIVSQGPLPAETVSPATSGGGAAMVGLTKEEKAAKAAEAQTAKVEKAAADKAAAAAKSEEQAKALAEIKAAAAVKVSERASERATRVRSSVCTPLDQSLGQEITD